MWISKVYDSRIDIFNSKLKIKFKSSFLDKENL